MIMLTSTPFLPRKRNWILYSVTNSSGSGKHLTHLYCVNTLIQPFIVSVKRKQIYLKLTVWEVSAFSCLMSLAVFSILITSFSSWSQAWYFSPHSCQLPGVSGSFSLWFSNTVELKLVRLLPKVYVTLGGYVRKHTESPVRQTERRAWKWPHSLHSAENTPQAC